MDEESGGASVTRLTTGTAPPPACTRQRVGPVATGGQERTKSSGSSWSNTALRIGMSAGNKEEQQQRKILVAVKRGRTGLRATIQQNSKVAQSCRFRWINHLDPMLNRRPFSEEEEERLLNTHSVHGNKWALELCRLCGKRSSHNFISRSTGDIT
ncbi:Transcription factor [Nymphaea thermarum]|nr:Transcription factor [Nymphaea thermarum]